MPGIPSHDGVKKSPEPRALLVILIVLGSFTALFVLISLLLPDDPPPPAPREAHGSTRDHRSDPSVDAEVDLDEKTHSDRERLPPPSEEEKPPFALTVRVTGARDGSPVPRFDYLLERWHAEGPRKELVVHDTIRDP